MMPRHSIFGLARAIVVAILVAASWPAFAQPDPALDARLKRLEEELRCLVCQNQSLADSNAPLAEDLRREVHGLAAAGKSDDEIKAFLVARYGDFVLYRPPVKSTTWLLWFGPLVLLIVGGMVWWQVGRRASHDHGNGGARVADRTPDAGADAELARASALLDAPPE